MDRSTFAAELLKCLTENEKMVDEKATGKGCYESLLFSYPQIKEKGAISLLQETTEFLNQEKISFSKPILPEYMVLTKDFINGILYCIDRKQFTPELRQALTDLLCNIFFLIPYTIIKVAKQCDFQSYLPTFQQLYEECNDVPSICASLFKDLNNGIACHVSSQHASKIHLRARLIDLHSFLLSQDCAPSFAIVWPDLLFFIRDYALLNPNEMNLLSDCILPIIQYYNGNHSLPTPPKREWSESYHEIVLGLLEPLCKLQETASPQFTYFIQRVLECSYPFLQQQHQLFVQSKCLPSSPSYYMLNSYVTLIQYFIVYYDGDAFTSLLSYGNMQFLYTICQSYPPTLMITEMASHCLLLLGLHCKKALDAFVRIPFVHALCTASNTSPYTSIYRILLCNQSDESCWKEDLSIPKLEELVECFRWLVSSPLLGTLTSLQKDNLSSFVSQCKTAMQGKMNAIQEETEGSQQEKERNVVLEKECYKNIIDLAKKLNVILIYGKNKCDYVVF